MNILIKNIKAIVPDNGHNAVIDTNIFIKDNYISSIGDIPAETVFDKTIDGHNRLAIPGLINSHSHSYMAFMRNAADDLSFMDWLFGRIDPIEQKMENEDAYWGANLAIMEMMKTGTTCFNDMQMHIGQTTKAVQESGMRAVISRGLVGSISDDDIMCRINEALKEKSDFSDCDRIKFFVGPHAPYTCDEGYLKLVAETARKNNMPVHMHLSESVSEIEGCMKDHACSPIEYAEKCGLFEMPFIAAHCVQVSESDMDILKKYNVSVVTNPASNMKLGNGFAPIPKMLDKGINVCIGTDGAASNNSLNLFNEMNLLALIHKGINRTPECISAEQIFNIATINGAKALTLSDEIGSLEEGKKADIVLLNTKTPSMWPNNNLLASLAYSANGSEVDTVIIDGKITVENGHCTTLDEERIYFETERIMNRICK